ncbi:MAG: aldo/keto reductase [Candidatus Azotimanducaceae bacterium]
MITTRQVLKRRSDIHAALDQGVRLIGTAPFNGSGAAEKIVGQAISGRRQQVEIATKFGVWRKSERGSPNGTKNSKLTCICLSPDAIEAQLNDSLRGLGVDYIELLRVHKPSISPELTPVKENMDCIKF